MFGEDNKKQKQKQRVAQNRRHQTQPERHSLSPFFSSFLHSAPSSSSSILFPPALPTPSSACCCFCCPASLFPPVFLSFPPMFSDSIFRRKPRKTLGLVRTYSSSNFVGTAHSLLIFCSLIPSGSSTSCISLLCFLPSADRHCSATHVSSWSFCTRPILPFFYWGDLA